MYGICPIDHQDLFIKYIIYNYVRLFIELFYIITQFKPYPR